MARAATEPVAPFGATRAGVVALVPEVTLFPGDDQPPADEYGNRDHGITEAQVDRWVDEVTEAVSMDLDGWERLTDTPVMDGATVVVVGDRTRFLGAARTVIHNGAASYLEAARHPERAGVNDTSYAAVLWDRYVTGRDRLAGWLTARLADADPGDTPAPDAATGPLFSFPEPLVGDALRF